MLSSVPLIAGRKTTSLQKQAVMQAATAAPPGPFGTAENAQQDNKSSTNCLLNQDST